ncbi:hypothetical protein MMC07_009650 [Pseudocyphellaria aurata]|nr:hypothetical protein [Pseudocyphellaria aurata]
MLWLHVIVHVGPQTEHLSAMTSFEEAVQEYYKAKESYTKLLHESIRAPRTNDASTNGHDAEKGENATGNEDWFLRDLLDSSANDCPKLDIGALMAKLQIAQEEPGKTPAKEKAKGRK